MPVQMQTEAKLAKETGDVWIAAASQDAQLDLQNADKTSLQGEGGDGRGEGPERREGEQKHHDPTEL